MTTPKKEKLEVISFRIAPKIADRIRKRAAKRKRDVSYLVRELVEGAYSA